MRQLATALLLLCLGGGLAVADATVSWPLLYQTFQTHDPTITAGAACDLPQLGGADGIVATNSVSGCTFKCNASSVYELIACPGSGGGSTVYAENISSTTSITLAHSFTSRDVIVACYDPSHKAVEPDTVDITGSSPYTVALTFFVPQTGRCVVYGGQ